MQSPDQNINTTYGEVLVATNAGIKKISEIPMPTKYSVEVLKLATEFEKILMFIETQRQELLARTDINAISSKEEKELKLNEEFYKILAKECTLDCSLVIIPSSCVETELSAIQIKNIQKFIKIV